MTWVTPSLSRLSLSPPLGSEEAALAEVGAEVDLAAHPAVLEHLEGDAAGREGIGERGHRDHGCDSSQRSTAALASSTAASGVSPCSRSVRHTSRSVSARSEATDALWSGSASTTSASN